MPSETPRGRRRSWSSSSGTGSPGAPDDRRGLAPQAGKRMLGHILWNFIPQGGSHPFGEKAPQLAQAASGRHQYQGFELALAACAFQELREFGREFVLLALMEIVARLHGMPDTAAGGSKAAARAVALQIALMPVDFGRDEIGDTRRGEPGPLRVKREKPCPRSIGDHDP